MQSEERESDVLGVLNNSATPEISASPLFTEFGVFISLFDLLERRLLRTFSAAEPGVLTLLEEIMAEERI